ncbi:MAG: hypothetical protein M3008_08750 [Chloroflexota bacterium]|nr:hypothetical protein [Chloroflexota bacterium]
MALLLLWLVGGVLCAGICTTLARRKVIHAERWAIYGLFFGVFAIAYLLWLPNVFTENAEAPEPHGGAPGLRKGKKRTP